MGKVEGETGRACSWGGRALRGGSGGTRRRRKPGCGCRWRLASFFFSWGVATRHQPRVAARIPRRPAWRAWQAAALLRVRGGRTGHVRNVYFAT